MKTRLLLLLLSCPLAGCKKAETPATPVQHAPTTTAVEAKAGTNPVSVTQSFLIWYRDHYAKLNEFKTIRGGVDPDSGADEGNYHVDFKEVDRYIAFLRGSGCLSERLLQGERQTFVEGEKHFLAEPENDGPPYGFDYDHFFLTQEAFEDDLADVGKIDFAVMPLGDGHTQVTFYLPLTNIRYAYYLRRIDGVWKIDRIAQVGE